MGGILISFLVEVSIITVNVNWRDYDIEDVSVGLQDFIICIEMFFAALAHVYAFPHEDYHIDQKPAMTIFQKIKMMLDIRDVQQDWNEHIDEVVIGVKETANKTKHLLKHEHKLINEKHHD